MKKITKENRKWQNSRQEQCFTVMFCNFLSFVRIQGTLDILQHHKETIQVFLGKLWHVNWTTWKMHWSFRTHKLVFANSLNLKFWVVNIWEKKKMNEIYGNETELYLYKKKSNQHKLPSNPLTSSKNTAWGRPKGLGIRILFNYYCGDFKSSAYFCR